MKNVGKWLFLAGIILSVVSGYITWSGMPLVLILLGFIVGFVNINERESQKFLVAAITLLVVGTAGMSALFSTGSLAGTIQLVLNDFVSFVAASAFVVALREIISTESEK
jgi:hypothetical protein